MGYATRRVWYSAPHAPCLTKGLCRTAVSKQSIEHNHAPRPGRATAIAGPSMPNVQRMSCWWSMAPTSDAHTDRRCDGLRSGLIILLRCHRLLVLPRLRAPPSAAAPAESVSTGAASTGSASAARQGVACRLRHSTGSWVSDAAARGNAIPSRPFRRSRPTRLLRTRHRRSRLRAPASRRGCRCGHR